MLLFLKFETYVHVQIAITYYYILFTNFLNHVKLKPTLGILFDEWP